ncbi:MAG: HPF/RaiA family ribosome-associated protein [Acidobacteriaceae bacterium]|jgi:putative sigma-54 modulation protein
MIIDYTGRQFIVTQKYKDRTHKGLKRIDRILGEAANAHIILTVDKYRKIAEVAVVVGSQSMVAVCESVEMMTALHHALGKIEQQAIRQKQKTTTTMRHPRVPVKATVVEPPVAAPAGV